MKGAVLLTTDPTRSEELGFEFPLRDVRALDGVADAPAFLVHREASIDGAAVLRAVRQHPRADIYLKPVVLLTSDEARDETGARSFDGVWDIGRHAEPPPGLSTAVERIRRTAATFVRSEDGQDTDLPLRVLRFVVSRGRDLMPVPTVRNPVGWIYPPLEPFLGDESGHMGSVLASLESRQVLDSSFVTRAYACTHCSSAFLSFQEVCPDCGSANLDADDNVHHFRCGYLGPLSDFVAGDDLVCPKCDRQLKHIGVDYDKPSMVYECNDCRLRVPEPRITTFCYRCTRTTPPEHQLHRTIRSYGITPYGENAASFGLKSQLEAALGKSLHLFDFESFTEFVDIEASRIGRYGVSKSSLVVLRLDGIERVYGELGQRSAELFEELTKAFSAILRDSDVLTARNESLFVALLTETPVEGAERAVQRLKEGVDELLAASLRNPPRLVGRALSVQAGIDVEEILATMSNGQGQDHAGAGAGA